MNSGQQAKGNPTENYSGQETESTNRWSEWDQRLNIAVNIGQFFAWAAAIAGVIWAWVNPGAVANYMLEVQRFAAEASVQLEAIEEAGQTTAENTERTAINTSTIAQSIAVWPIFSTLRFEFSPPTIGAFAIDVENPRNLVVREFSAQIHLKGSITGTKVQLEGGKLIPPNESYTLSANIIREDWFQKRFLNYDGQELTLCISGLVEGDAKTFYESRTYSVDEEGNVGSLLDREFNVGQPSENCR